MRKIQFGFDCRLDELWAQLCEAEEWLRDIQAGRWPRGRTVAGRQARVLERIIPRLRQAYEWAEKMQHPERFG